MQCLLGQPLSQVRLKAVNEGKVAEQFVAQELQSLTPSNHTPELYYWARESRSSQAEVDFVVNSQGAIVPIEVKAGKDRSSKSLLVFAKEKLPSRMIRLCLDGFSQQGAIEIAPLFCALPEFLDRALNLYEES